MGLFFPEMCGSEARLDGKTAVVTGANTGIGRATVADLLRRGCRVVMGCRDVGKGEAARRELEADLAGEPGSRPGAALVARLDLASFASVRSFARRLLDSEQRIDLLVNNSGVMCPRSLSEDGFELQLATNHLGHFLLTLLLLPRIIASAPARIINLSSHAHHYASPIDFEDINMEKNYGIFRSYSRSKLANVQFTRELAKRLKGSGVTAYSVHPGVVRTEIGRNVEGMLYGWVRPLVRAALSPFMLTPEQGAQTTLYCALDRSLAHRSGFYYKDCKEATMSAAGQNDEMCRELWEKSLQYVGLPSFDLLQQ